MKLRAFTKHSSAVAANDRAFTDLSVSLLSEQKTSPLDLNNGHNVQEEHKILSAKLEEVYQQLPLSIATVFFLLALNSAALYFYEPKTEVIVWLGLSFCLALIRMQHFRSFTQEKEHTDLKKWLRIHAIDTIVSASFWGYAAWSLMPDNSMPHQFILLITIAGLAAGASSSLSLTPKVYLTYMLVSIVPLSIRLYYLDPDYSFLLVSFCYIYMFFIWRTCVRNGNTASSNIMKSFSLESQENNLEDYRRRLNLQIENSPLAVIEWDSQLNITRWNPAAERLFGYRSSEISGKKPEYLITNEQDLQHFKHLKKSPIGLDETLSCKTEGGESIICEWTSAALLAKNGALLGFTSFIRDVSKRIEHEEFIKKQAFYDNLTGLPNRQYFQDRLQQELSRVSRQNSYSAIFFIDLDNFKNINDSLGHDFGDQLLQQFSDRLRHRLRKHETVARFGGDEFVVLLEKLGEDSTKAQLLTAELAVSLKDLMKEPFHLGGSHYRLTCSIGITLFNSEEYEQNELLKQADLALYESKKKGRNAYSFFEKTMGNKASRHLQLLDNLRGVITRNEMWIVFQPKVDMKHMQLKGAEVLVRWKNEELGMVSPQEFIPVLENSSMMSDIGFWIIEKSFSQLKQWCVEGLWPEGARLSINLSPRQLLSQSFTSAIKELLKQYDLDSRSIEFEITENVLVNNTETVSAVLEELNNMGISFSIDDFGTGYSSLAYLKRLPIDVIKIDKSFIDYLTSNSNDKAIVKSILSICTELKIVSVAEGVETEDQRLELVNLGCDLLQGYLYSKPLEAEDMTDLLNAREEARCLGTE